MLETILPCFSAIECKLDTVDGYPAPVVREAFYLVYPISVTYEAYAFVMRWLAYDGL